MATSWQSKAPGKEREECKKAETEEGAVVAEPKEISVAEEDKEEAPIIPCSKAIKDETILKVEHGDLLAKASSGWKTVYCSVRISVLSAMHCF